MEKLHGWLEAQFADRKAAHLRSGQGDQVSVTALEIRSFRGAESQKAFGRAYRTLK
jgi:hypothetical protein